MSNFYKKWFFPFVLPALFVFIAVVLIPFIIGIFYSFTGWRGSYFIGANGRTDNPFEAIIGLQNYIAAFKQESFRSAFLFSVKFTVIAVIAVNIVALAQALLINAIGKAVGFFRATFFLPNLLGGLSLGFIWLFIYSNIFTKVLFGKDGIFPFEFLTYMTDKGQTKLLVAILIMVVWQMSGYMMIIYTTGLANIPDDLYEAASIDGANSIQKFFKITIPMLMPSFTIVFFLVLSKCFMLLDQNIALTNNAPQGYRMLAAQILRVTTDTNNNYGIAQAEAVVFFIVVAAISITQVVITKRKEVEM
ncbi:MAG: sugar ABC transporter permease [Streptococcaceae bacterium]|jgi:raffinose/stachyose/melibiose transport system permease protein|nr:sugar ABC transporter permease [Streptococcaceae bacterium]MCH4176361.1 sugar ABC transporter permease [Streptococcaceae bacterium]